jgi:CRP/FNR family transcriptional regulator, cyclic AMP receptor protein
VAKDELGEIDWLATCTSRERATIRRRCDLIEVPAGTVLIREGDAPRWFYALVDGTARAAVGGDAVGRVNRGEPINELELLRNEPAPATVTAETDLRIFVMGRREFLGMLDEVPGLARRLLVPHLRPVAAAARRGRPALVPLPAA